MQKYPVIVGLGKSGLSCANYFARRSVKFAVMDTRQDPPGLATFRQRFSNSDLHLGAFNQAWLTQASEIIVSPGISLEEPALIKARQQGIPVIGDIELFAREAKAPIIAITGTNAKGTVTTLVTAMINNAGCKALMGGNIGTPALDLLAEETPDFYVLEISSFQLESTLHLPAHAATILNISPDHLDRHGTMQNYQATKQRIYRHCACAVFNRHDPLTAPQFPVQNQLSFGLDAPQAQQFGIKDGYLAFGSEQLLATEMLRIKGKHNWLNVLAALALGHALGLPLTTMLETLTQFPGLAHRCEWVATAKNIQWYNDSKGTNVGATIAALEGLSGTLTGKIILIAGGVGKNADFAQLQPAVKHYTRCVILIGRDAPILARALQAQTQIVFAETLMQAIMLSAQYAQPGDAVLLSPACASFDMFRDFEDRGEQFKQWVRNFIENDSNH